MTIEELEVRLTKAEQAIEALQKQVAGTGLLQHFLNREPDPEMEAAFEEMQPYCLYFRRTGESPPPEWNPGDPIPEPDHWS